jgi:two-component system, cell cycle sensor histidine kinase and response regulator CckA
VLLVLVFVGPALCAQEAELPEHDLNRPVVFGAAEVFYPYSYRDKSDGKIKGFAVDLVDALAEAVDVRVQRVPLLNTQFGDALRTGRIDAIQFWSETAERRTWAEFSVPILRFETVVVVRKDDGPIRALADLEGRRVAVGQRGTVGERYILEKQPGAIRVYTETSEEFLRMLSAGGCDAAVMSRLTALSMIDWLGLKNLRVLDARLPGNDYDVRYCFAVRKGDSLLLARLNEGLAILHRRGTYDDIYQRWFGRYEKRSYSPLEVVSYVAAALALACAVATWGFLAQRRLSRRIARQAAELAEQRSILAALHEKHPLATLVLEVAAPGKAVLVSLNPEAARLFGLDASAVVGKDLSELALSPEARLLLEDAVARSRSSAHFEPVETQLRATQQFIETTLVPLGPTEAGGQRLCVLSADITKRRLMDQEVAQSRRLRALGELVGGIAHEFNNLLTPIIGTTQMLQLDRAADRELQAELEVTAQAAKRAAELTRRLLTFGRKGDEEARSIRLADAVVNCFALVRPMVDRRIVWEVDVPPDLPPVFFNPTDLNQIVINLVLNARDTLVDRLGLDRGPAAGWTPCLRVIGAALPASAHPAPPRAGGRELAGWSVITVEDNGMGIAPENIDRIFEPFFTTKEVGKGTGLGLATVWHLVNDAGGFVTVESAVGEGTKIRVTLPRWKGVEDDTIELSGPISTQAPASQRCVLLVEDEQLVARTAIAVLERFGHVVTHLLDGAEAWSRLSGGNTSFDVLLLDVNMPRMNGVELVRRVRGRGFPGRIVVMSGRVGEEEMNAMRELRVDRVLTKPFSAGDLVDAVRG